MHNNMKCVHMQMHQAISICVRILYLVRECDYWGRALPSFAFDTDTRWKQGFDQLLRRCERVLRFMGREVQGR